MAVAGRHEALYDYDHGQASGDGPQNPRVYEVAVTGRTNIVLTRDPDWQREGVHVVGDLAAALELAEQQSLIDGTDETMIIGGAEIYAQALPLADRLYVTRVHDSPLGDVYFPPVEFADWRLLSQQQHEADERHSAPCTIEVYER